MKTTENYWEARGWFKDTEEDSFGEGRKPDTGQSASGNETFRAETLETLIEKLMEFACTDDKSSVLIDSCEEPGRIDIQTMEDVDGTTPSAEQIADWKRGEETLYAATYSFRVAHITREERNLSELLGKASGYEING